VTLEVIFFWLPQQRAALRGAELHRQLGPLLSARRRAQPLDVLEENRWVTGSFELHARSCSRYVVAAATLRACEEPPNVVVLAGAPRFRLDARIGSLGSSTGDGGGGRKRAQSSRELELERGRARRAVARRSWVSSGNHVR
jgi:hypothetical protein